jgi:CRISPR-associated protein Cas5, subtype I-B/HMARI
MKVLKFKLSGRTAFFKKPEVNTYVYFTYGNIHKVALMGIFGAILGYGGYAQMKKEDEYPEFYRRLCNIKVAIAPDSSCYGTFDRKIYEFNNSVGYASKEQGGNLIVKQQWLEKPLWHIYVALDNEEVEKLKIQIMNRRCVYMPYLGSNDHPADITDAEVVDVKAEEYTDQIQIDSLFQAEHSETDYDADVIGIGYRYRENLPVKLIKGSNQYETVMMEFTNFPIEKTDNTIYKIDGKNIVFF